MIKESEKLASQKTQDFEYEVIYSLRYQPCENPKCLACMIGKKHGPYWYATLNIQGVSKTVYMGENFKKIDIKDLDSIMMDKKTAEKETQNLYSKKKVTAKINKDSASQLKAEIKLPTQQEFDRDISVLNSSVQKQILKPIYKSLIKKYHPDQYPEDIKLTAWMAEINYRFDELLKKAI